MQVLHHNIDAAGKQCKYKMNSEGSWLTMMRAVVEFRDFLKNVRSFKWEVVSMPAQAFSFGNGNMAELISSVEQSNRGYHRSNYGPRF